MHKLTGVLHSAPTTATATSPAADKCVYARTDLCCVQSPYHCNLLIAGFDEGAGASLYWVDYLATLHKVNTGGTGYGEQNVQ